MSESEHLYRGILQIGKFTQQKVIALSGEAAIVRLADEAQISRYPHVSPAEMQRTHPLRSTRLNWKNSTCRIKIHEL